MKRAGRAPGRGGDEHDERLREQLGELASELDERGANRMSRAAERERTSRAAGRVRTGRAAGRAAERLLNEPLQDELEDERERLEDEHEGLEGSSERRARTLALSSRDERWQRV